DGVAGQGLPRFIQIKGPGPAGGAAVGLGVVAAAAQVGVFGGAAAAHGKPGHGGIGPVVGQGPQDGKSGPAVGAVDERIAVPPAVLGRMAKAVSPRQEARGRTVTCSTTARGGGPARSVRTNASMASGGPSSSSSTPAGVLRAQPPRPSRDASRWRNGRNPTP